MSKEIKVTPRFDKDKCRQYLNDEVSVFHCHHYASLFSQLADDAKLLRGPALLSAAAEESMGSVLKKYYKDNSITDISDRISIAEQYFSYIGLGRVKLSNVTNTGGHAEMTNSHVDEGWIKKWSKRDKPINFIGQGFLAGAFSAITDKNFGSYKVTETESIVTGAPKSSFTIKSN